jgi:hypothetical protein
MAGIGDILGGAVSGGAAGSAVPGVGTAIGAGIGLLGGISKYLTGVKQQKLADSVTGSPEVDEQLNQIRNLMNARMPGATQYQQQIDQNQANTNANNQKIAGDASQLIAGANNAQEVANNATVNLAAKEGEYKSGLLNNLQSAYNAKTQDQRYVNQLKGNLVSSGLKNKAGALNDVSSLAMLLDQAGLFGKKGGLGTGIGSIIGNTMQNYKPNQKVNNGIGNSIGNIFGNTMQNYNTPLSQLNANDAQYLDFLNNQ